MEECSRHEKLFDICHMCVEFGVAWFYLNFKLNIPKDSLLSIFEDMLKPESTFLVFALHGNQIGYDINFNYLYLDVGFYFGTDACLLNIHSYVYFKDILEIKLYGCVRNIFPTYHLIENRFRKIGKASPFLFRPLRIIEKNFIEEGGINQFRYCSEFFI